MKFILQISLATIVMGASVAGLVLLGRSEAEQAPLPLVQKNEPTRVAQVEDKESAVAALPVDLQSARSFVPPDAWIVADFRGDITGRTPFSDQPGACQTVAAPERVAVAILPPKGNTQPELLLAAPNVSAEFWNCAVARIEGAGGVPLAENEEYQVFQSPSGIVARGPGGAMVFLTSQTQLETALAVLSQLSPSAAQEGPHAGLLARMHPEGVDRSQVALDATLALPSDWMSSVGQDAEKSPLRHLRAAFLSAKEDGSAQGGVDCEESGCAEVLTFLLRAQRDLLAGLPPAIGQAVQNSLSARHLEGTGRIAIDWAPSGLDWGQLLGRFLGP
jgi:hypothetical protein